MPATTPPTAAGAVAAGLTRYQNVWWDQANITCQLVSGARDKAALALDVMHDRDATPDPLFDTLVAAATGGRGVKLDKHAVLTPLRAALWASGKRPLPARRSRRMDARNRGGIRRQRRAVAKPASRRRTCRGARRLAAGPARGALWQAQHSATPSAATSALGPKMARDAPQGRALLFARLRNRTAAPRSVAKRWSNILAAAQQHGLYFVAARIAAPIVAAIGPNDGAKDAAPDLYSCA